MASLARPSLLSVASAFATLALAVACGGSATTASGDTSATVTGSTTTGGGGRGGASQGTGGATSTATAAGGFGGWGTGGGCPAAAAASPFGDPAGACGACMSSKCGALVAVCFGPGWASGSYAGSCEDFQRCLCTCLAGGADATTCASTCAPRITSDCSDCSPLLSKCQKESCSGACGSGGG